MGKHSSLTPPPTTSGKKILLGGSKSKKATSGVFGKGLAFGFQKKSNTIQQSSVFARTRSHGTRTTSGGEGTDKKEDPLDGLLGSDGTKDETKEGSRDADSEAEGEDKKHPGEGGASGGNDDDGDDDDDDDDVVTAGDDAKPEENGKKETWPESGEEKKGFLRVLSRDGTTELEWPAEMMRQTQTAKPAISFSVNPLFFNFSHLVSTAGSDGSEEAAIKIKLEDYEVKISAEDGVVDGAASQKGTEEQEQQQQQAVEKTQMGTKGGKEKSGIRKGGAGAAAAAGGGENANGNEGRKGEKW